MDYAKVQIKDSLAQMSQTRTDWPVRTDELVGLRLRCWGGFGLFGHQRGEALHERKRRHHQMRGTATIGIL
jgi:hypothetical protein